MERSTVGETVFLRLIDGYIDVRGIVVLDLYMSHFSNVLFLFF